MSQMASRYLLRGSGTPYLDHRFVIVEGLNKTLQEERQGCVFSQQVAQLQHVHATRGCPDEVCHREKSASSKATQPPARGVRGSTIIAPKVVF
jgi:hypothetical protein